MTVFAARLAALPQRLQDLVLAISLAAVNVGSLLPYRSQLHRPAAAFALVLLESLPLGWRRTRPVLVFLAIGLARAGYDQLALGFAPLPLGPAIAYYTVVDRCGARARIAVSVVLLAGIVNSQLVPGHTEPYDFFVAALIFVAAATAGVRSRSTRQAHQAEISARSARAEAERGRDAALAAATERTRIARELHDVVAHHVSLMAVQAEAAASLLPGQPDAALRSAEIIGQTARQALTELRRLLGVLRGPGDQQLEMAPARSLAALSSVLEQVRGAGVPVEFRIEGTPSVLTAGIDLTAYRIVQEALTNTVRHAPASSAAVTLRYEPGFIAVSITDSGPGAGCSAPVRRPAVAAGAVIGRAVTGTAAAGAAAVTGLADGAGTAGFGLVGIAERVASCGGSLSLGPTAAGGFAVTARLPAR